MRKEKLTIALFLYVFIALGGCTWSWIEGHRYITIVNDSNIDIYAACDNVFPDTLFEEFNQTYHNYYPVESKSTARLGFNRPYMTYEDIFSNMKSDTLMVFIIKAKELDSICVDERTDWPCLLGDLKSLNDKLVLRRYYLTLSDLDKKDWTITYP